MTILQQAKKRFPQYLVWLQPSSRNPFCNLLCIKAEEGERYNSDGSPNPEYWWHEWGVEINRDEGKISRAEIDNQLDEMGLLIKDQIDYYHSPEWAESNRGG